MKTELHGNQLTRTLSSGERYFFKPALLQGFSDYDWTLPPPFPWGSPFMRLYHRCWIWKTVMAEKPKDIPVHGTHPRGNFMTLQLEPDEEVCVFVRYLAGFSGEIRNLHTRIKFALPFWLLHKHFFCTLKGPGEILLYGSASMNASPLREHAPHRLVAFEAEKRFRPIAAHHRTTRSQLVNILFSHEVIWEFEEAGGVVVETSNEGASSPEEHPFRSAIKHILGFFRI